jgi:hypothetical protein
MKRLVSILVVLAAATLWLPLAAQAEDFGLKDLDVTFTNQDGSPATQAGSHPFAANFVLDVKTTSGEHGEVPIDAVKDIKITQPAGFVGDPTAVPRCPSAVFVESATDPTRRCPDETVLGRTTVVLGTASDPPEPFTEPVYNLAPAPGTLLKLAFIADGVPVTLDVGLGDTYPYSPVVTAANIPNPVSFYASSTTIWGNPASPAHDGERGACLGLHGESLGSCPVSSPEKPFITLPRSCTGPLETVFEADSWQNPAVPFPFRESTLTHDASNPPSPLGMTGCDKLGFNPTITAQPTTRAAQSPTGLDFSLDVHDENLTSSAATANSDIKKAVVTLPEGFTTNPSLAEGLNVCSEADLARETVSSAPGVGCPNESKIGTVEVESPLLEENVNGSLFIATPYENEVGSLLALYMVIKNPQLGIIVKQALKVENNPVTGQITTVADNIPQLPFSHFRLHFREGTRSPLASPPLCGEYDAQAVLTPWSGGAPLPTSSAFSIVSGPNGSGCPSGGTPPFHPGLEAGTINNAAGHYSPFYVHLSRNDGEQEITHFSIKLPPGVTGKLAGIPFCPDADIAAAKAREGTPHGGQEELERPSCPQASEVGHTLAGAGVGPSLTYVPGKAYLAGPFNGAPLSIVAITAAKAGPFDLGTVVVREALRVNPETAEVFVDAGTSDPIPHIIDGIPVHLRDIRIYVDRPEFVLNPTSCEPTSTASTVLGSGTDFASEADDRPVTVTSRFQAADCANLGFRPALKISLKGPTKRAGLPALTAVVTPRAADANIGRAVVTLPPSEFLEQGHIGNSCTRVQFNAGGGNGEHCPANSVLGHAVAVTPLLSEPLEGPVFLRSNGGERKLPDLVAALHSTDINIDLVGFIDSLHKKGSDVSQIRTTFAKVPDQPVTRFTLQMFGGKKGLLVNSTNLCKGTHKAISEFTGQNGKRYDTEPAVKAQCGKKGKKAAKKSKAKGKKGNSRPALIILHHVAW